MSETDIQKPRLLTFEERATWGTCPVCGAAPGVWCSADVGIPMGDVPQGGGAHLGRLQKAPIKVQLISAD